MILGKYFVDTTHGDGRVVISWNDQGKTMRIIIRDGVKMIDEIVNRQLSMPIQCAQAFRMAFTDMSFYDDLNNKDIFTHLPDMVPGLTLRGNDLFIWHIRNFINAYYQRLGMTPKDADVEYVMNACQDMAVTF